MDPYSSPYIIPNNRPQYPFPHSLLSTREYRDLQVFLERGRGLGVEGFGFRGFKDLGFLSRRLEA